MLFTFLSSEPSNEPDSSGPSVNVGGHKMLKACVSECQEKGKEGRETDTQTDMVSFLK